MDLVDQVLRYCLMLENTRLSAKVGYFLSLRQDAFSVSEKQLEPLQATKPKVPQCVNRTPKDKFQLIKEWNIYLPKSVINHGKKKRLSSKEQLMKQAHTEGYKPEILEKVYRLLDVFQQIISVPFLKERMALKGGTALNLFCLANLPRLSVDIDLNYIGSLDREIMLLVALTKDNHAT